MTYTTGLDFTLTSGFTSGTDLTVGDGSGTVSNSLALLWDSYTLVPDSLSLLWNLTSATANLAAESADVLSIQDPAAKVAALQIDILSMIELNPPIVLAALHTDMISVQDPVAKLDNLHVDLLSVVFNAKARVDTLHIDILCTNDDITPRPKVFVNS